MDFDSQWSVLPGDLHPVVPGTVSVVFPCLNEQASVGHCVTQALDALGEAGIPGEVVVVDNGSTDSSAEVAVSHGARVVKERRRGYGAALQAGFRAARGEFVVMADADLTYELAQIPNLVRPLLQGDADLVLGARLSDANGSSMPFLHRFVGTPALTFLVRRATGGLSVSDSQSGFRAFRRSALLDLGLKGSGMEFASEMLIQAARAGWRIREIETRYGERVGQSKLETFSDGWRHLRLITLLAPELILVAPGGALLLIGLLLSLESVLNPSGVSIGSLRWQPVFFSTIALVLGAQALLAGMVMAHRSSTVAPVTQRRYAFVGKSSFPRTCMRGGGLLATIGASVDAALFIRWISGDEGTARELALAALAQGFIIVGSGIVLFGVVTRLLLDRRRTELGIGDLGLADLFRPVGPPEERMALVHE